MLHKLSRCRCIHNHNLVAMQMSVKLKKLERVRRKQKWNMERMKKNGLPCRRGVEDEIKSNTGVGLNANQRWNEFKGVILRNAQKQIGYEKKERIKKSWITPQMINKMDERRRRYRQLSNELRREANKAKEEWWNAECNELEELNAKGRSDMVYAKVAKLTWKNRGTGRSVSVEDDAGKTITDPEEVRERWRTYIET